MFISPLKTTKLLETLVCRSCETIFKQIDWQPLFNVYKRKLALLMHSVFYNQAPKTICDLFHKDKQSFYNLRRADKFIIPHYNYLIGRNSLSYRGPTLWNMLPETYKQEANLSSFKTKIKKDLGF